MRERGMSLMQLYFVLQFGEVDEALEHVGSEAADPVVGEVSEGDRRKEGGIIVWRDISSPIGFRDTFKRYPAEEISQKCTEAH